ncbi:MAG TPA: helix-turn-helix domain-containing protein [Terracidiphilus sp.]|nr:helix-turn-helix domain-containing protein [Terracidiphilus sp.]
MPATNPEAVAKRPYDLGKRMEHMDQNRSAILRAARQQLEDRGYRELTMASLAAASGVTRQTIHNLFGTKAAVIEALFDVLALDGGMENMREVMIQPSPEAMLERFVEVMCDFWSGNRLLFRRVHGIAAIDPVLGAVLDARNHRRLMGATRIAGLSGVRDHLDQTAAALAALTSFEFYDALVGDALNPDQATAGILSLARDLLARMRS